MHDFIYDASPGRVVFRSGALSLVAAEAERLGFHRVLLIASQSQGAAARQVIEALSDRIVAHIAEAVMHVPVDRAMAARDLARETDADSVVCIGGGSAVGLAKAVALETALPILAVPTTYAGSEMTDIWGIAEIGVKRTGRDRAVLPRCVVYDPALTLDLPIAVAGPSGINAIAHAVEALYAENANPVTSMMAEEGIRAMAAGLRAIARMPADIEARGMALYGAWLSGAALGVAAMGLHHKLCHVLGGAFALPHAECHTVVLPHAAAFNATAAPSAMARVGQALGVEAVPAGLYDLAAEIGAPLALRDIGMKVADLDRAAAQATETPHYNPRPVELAGVRALLDDAYHGRRPG